MNQIQPTADLTDVATVDQQIEQHAQNIERIQRDAIIEIGRELSEAQLLFKYTGSDGGFTSWLTNRLPHMSQSAAYRAIEAFKGIDLEMFPNLGKHSDQAVLEIAKAEPDVKAIIAERVAAGEVFTAAQVKEIKDAAAAAEVAFKAGLEAAERTSLEAQEQEKATAAELKAYLERGDAALPDNEQPTLDISSAVEAATKAKQDEIDRLQAKIEEIENDPTMKAMREAALEAAKSGGKAKASRRNPLHNPNKAAAIALSITGPCRLLVDAKGVNPATFWTGFHDEEHRADGIEIVKRALDLLNTLLEHSDAE